MSAAPSRSPVAIAHAGPALERLLERFGLMPEPEPRSAPTTARPTPPATIRLDDEDLLNRARRAANGREFADLYDRPPAPGEDWSQRDFALLGHLIGWCGPDAARIDRVFRGSACMRPKWDERHSGAGETYGEISIRNIIARHGNGWVYDPNSGRPGPVARVGSLATATALGGEAIPADVADPHYLARAWIAAGRIDGFATVASYRGEFWRHDGRRWAACRTGELQAELTAFVRNHLDAVAAPGDRPRPVTQKRIADVLGAIAGEVLIREVAAPEMPFWIGGPPRPELSAKDMVAFQNVLIHLPSLLDGSTDYAMAHTPALFSTVCLPFAFDPAAPEPVEFLRFLESSWPGDPESIATLQEFFGYFLTADTSQQKILIIIGPPRAGKGIIGRIIVCLIGKDNCVSVNLPGLASHFGAAQLIGKSLAVIPDCRVPKVDTSAAVERLLSVSGEDMQTIDIKYKHAWTGRLPTRFMLMSNETPTLMDASTALANRFIVLRLETSHLGREDRGLESRLRAELPGILLWALDGARRLRDRGHFVQPASARPVVDELVALGSPISAFLADRCEVGPGHTVAMNDLYQAWRGWCESEGRDHPGTAAAFGRSLRAAVPGLAHGFSHPGGKTVRVYHGVGLAPDDASATF